MQLQLLLLSVGIAIAVAGVVAAVAILLRARGASRTRQQRLQKFSTEKDPDVAAAGPIVREAQHTPLDRLLQRWTVLQRLQRLLKQGNVSIGLGQFLIIMVILAVLGAAIAAKISGWAPAALIGGPFAASIPVFVATHKKRRLLAAFEKNFPDSLDILTSALRAGLAFSAAVQVVAEESPDPVAKEFHILFEENRLGLDMKEALRNLAMRVDSAELRMFVTAVILQRETGGNLVEILEGTAFVIRDRFRILGEVRALTAQQRFSGIILSVLPLVMAGLLLVTAPDYMKVLVDDPWGRYLIVGALFLQLIGFLSIRRIVAIKV